MFETILVTLEANLVHLNPEIDMTVPQPASQILDACAEALYNAFALQNNVNLQLYVQFALGVSLRQLALERGVEIDPDDSLQTTRNKIMNKPFAGSTSTQASLQATVLTDNTLSPKVRSIYFLTDRATLDTTFYPLAKGDGQKENTPLGTPTDALKAELTTFLNGDDVAQLFDQFISADPTITLWYATINARNISFDGTFNDIVVATRAELNKWIDDSYTLNNTIRQEDIYRALSAVAGVGFEIVRLNTVSPTDNGLGDIASPGRNIALLGTDDTIAINEVQGNVN